MEESMKKVLILFFIVIVLTGFMAADYYVKQNTHTDAFNAMGKDTPAKDVISETWIGENMIVSVSEDKTTIMDLKAKVVYHINHGNKTYVKMTLPINLEKYMGSAAKQTKAMMGKMKFSVTHKPDKKKIGKWNCHLYVGKLEMMGGMVKVDMNMWVTKDIPFDLKMMKKFSDVVMNLGGGFGGKEMISEFKKIDGYQIYSDMSVGAMGVNMKMKVKVLEITKKPAPVGLYTVPKDYKEVKTLPAPKGMM
jgi:hypothetical protein